jgi:hypothetical protein
MLQGGLLTVIRVFRSGHSCCVARLKCFEFVGRGNVAVNDAITLRLELTDRSPIQLRVLRLPELPPASITLFVQPDARGSIDADRIRQSFVQSIAHGQQSVAVNSGSILPIEAASQPAHAIVDIQYAGDAGFDQTLIEGKDNEVIWSWHRLT